MSNVTRIPSQIESEDPSVATHSLWFGDEQGRSEAGGAAVTGVAPDWSGSPFST